MTQDLRQIEKRDQIGHRQLLTVAFWRPSQQRQVVNHRFRRVALLHVRGERCANVTFAHLGSFRVQDQRYVGILGRLDAECLEQRDVLGGVGQMIFTPDHVCDVHFQVIHHVHKMKYRLPVRTHDNEIRLHLFAIG